MPDLVLTERDLEVMRGTGGAGTVASVAFHIGILVVVFVLATVRPFAPTTTDAIMVELVPANEVPKSADQSSADQLPADKPDDAAKFSLPQPAPMASQPIQPSSPPPAAAEQSKPAPNKLNSKADASASQPRGAPPVPAQSSPALPAPLATTSAPDITEKYGVMLGLSDRSTGFDAAASDKAAIGDTFISSFKNHLKTCSVLPGSIGSTDKVGIKLRVAFTNDGRLAGPPSVIEASASAKGPLLMQASIDALVACQPYAMLPADKYREWRVLDLNFTPADFKGG